MRVFINGITEINDKKLFFGNTILATFAKISFVEKGLPLENAGDSSRIEIGFVPEDRKARLLVNINFFILVLKAFREAVDARSRRNEVNRILSSIDWIEHYKDGYTGRRVLAESVSIDYDHEKFTAICLTQVNYDVVFAPKGLFQRNDKKFDVYLLRDTREYLRYLKTKRATHEALLKSLSLGDYEIVRPPIV